MQLSQLGQAVLNQFRFEAVINLHLHESKMVCGLKQLTFPKHNGRPEKLRKWELAFGLFSESTSPATASAQF